ncbi:MAG TPA: STAS domain-containing protein [Bryobacteraceae bacterium]|jgi:anti-sigma B factor antagonist|nr:STAS domain-containing protein [Bryobacteraceae bacterium]
MITEARRIGQATVIKLFESRLGGDIAAEFKTEIEKYVEAGETRIVLDLANLTFMDSSGLGAILSVFKMIGKRGDLAIAGTQGAVQNLFRLTHMDKVFRSYATVPEAIAALTPHRAFQGY